MRRSFRGNKVLIVTLCLSIAWHPHAWSISIDRTELPSEGKARLEKLISDIDHLRTSINRTEFDVDALLDSLDYDPIRIAKFVTNEIHLQQYAGSLRGPQGTLMSRAGNSLDQALLAAKLLNDAGLEARIARADLSNAALKQLMQQLAIKPADAETDYGEGETMLTAMMESVVTDEDDRQLFQDLLAPSPDPTTFDLFEAAEAEFEKVMSQLQNSDFSFDTTGAISSVAREAADYFWVQYRDGPSGWTDLHPAVPSLADAGISPSGYFTESVPEQLVHTLTLRTKLEQKVGDRLVVSDLASPWVRPVANIHGRAFTYSNVPSDAQTAALAIANGDIASIGFLFPGFETSLARGGRFFDLAGNTLPAEAAASPAAALFETVSAKSRSATDALASIGSTKHQVPQMTLTAQWLEFTLSGPGISKTWRRDLVDRLGSAARQQKDFSGLSANEDELIGLLGGYTFMINVGAIPDSYILDATLENVRAAVTALKTTLYEGSGSVSIDQLAEQLPGTNPLFPALAYRSFDAIVPKVKGHSYRNEASLIGIEERLGWVTGKGPSVRIGVDIVNNSRRSFVSSNTGTALDPATTMLLGIWDSLAEAAILYSTTDDPYSGSRWIRQARLRSEALKLIDHERDLPPLVGAAKNADAIMRAQLANGKVLLVAQDPTSLADDDYSWWQVDPETGTTLAIGSDGRGPSLTEYLTNLAAGWPVAFGTCMMVSTVLLIVVAAATGGSTDDMMSQLGSDAKSCAIMSIGAAGLFANVRTAGAKIWVLVPIREGGATIVKKTLVSKHGATGMLLALSFVLSKLNSAIEMGSE